jgi:hypothetical protein
MEFLLTVLITFALAGGLGVFEPRGAAKKYPRQDPLSAPISIKRINIDFALLRQKNPPFLL